MSKEDLLKATLELAKAENYCYQKYKLQPNSSCIIKEKNIIGKNLLEGTYFDGNGIPKMIGITKAEYLEYKQLKDKLSKIETLIINHNCDTGDIYYKYNNRFLKSELKQRILEIVYEVS